MAEERGSRDLVLAPGEFAYIADDTKGLVDVCVGPFKVSLANTERPVTFSAKSKRFEAIKLEERTLFTTAPEGWYIVLKNPAKDDVHPGPNSRPNVPPLQIGRKINVAGPQSFALWPGQMARVLQGHHIRSNQYLVVRVYDEEAARANWKRAVIKPATSETGEAPPPVEEPPTLTMGQLLIIKGTKTSFYIPPTGIEVVADDKAALVREAVTLERLEYCVLLDENGKKRTEQGPAVVFPEPTEKFITKVADGQQARKFRAIELNENSGIYIKVIAAYEDEDGGEYAEGQELFITGKTQKIYFPREEHAIIKYGDREIHFATAIPAGEGRYVLNRDTSEIRVEHGPSMFLPDPRHEVICRRVLDAKLVSFLYPNNAEALAYNAALAQQMAKTAASNLPAMVGSDSSMFSNALMSYADSGGTQVASYGGAGVPTLGATGRGFAGDEISRKQGYTEPRTIMLNTRYQGAVTIEPWIGYAVMLVRKTGDRKVVIGPSTVLLEYDETPQVMQLSTGTPKTDAKLYPTAYLCVNANHVSDIVFAETSDLVDVNVTLSYRVNFEGDDPKRWFAVDNYVKFLCDHMRSRIRNAIMHCTVERFYFHAVDLLRDTILGVATETTKRPGTLFAENGMRIYDVEVLDVKISDADVAKMLVDGQRSAIRQDVELQLAARNLEYTKASEEIKQSKLDAEAATVKHHVDIKKVQVVDQLNLDLLIVQNSLRTTVAQGDVGIAEAKASIAVELLELEQRQVERSAEANMRRLDIENHIKEIEAEVQAVVDKAKAVSPQLIAALTALGDSQSLERVAEAMAPLAILRNSGINEVVGKLLEGTALGKRLLSSGAPIADSNGVAE
jgi:major vault protein